MSDQIPASSVTSALPFREEYWAGENSRRIGRRIVIEGDLVLQTPTHLGNGEDDGVTDMTLLTDPCDDLTPLLTGASLAGALRNHLRERIWGYGKVAPPGKTDISYELFGDEKGRDDPNDPNAPKAQQSNLIVDDAFGREASFGIEQRDGVRIDPVSRTACENAKYDAQFWEAGTTFPLRLELLLGEDGAGTQDTSRALRTALGGLHDDLGGITLGARKRRGFGAAKGLDWKTHSYDLSTSEGLRAWLLEDDGETKSGLAALGTELSEDAREYFDVRLTLHPESSILVRDKDKGQDAPDSAHLHSRRIDSNGKVTSEPVLPGTGVAGVLSACAAKIARTLRVALANGDESTVTELINQLFGTMEKGAARASRFECQERVLENMSCDLVQGRVSIDYFTGGARGSRLFNEQPAIANPESRAQLNWRLRNPQSHEMGLLLQVVKDVWTGDVAFGGEKSVGRGLFKGIKAAFVHRAKVQNEYLQDEWQLNASGTSDDSLNDLEAFAEKLVEWAKTEVEQQSQKENTP